MDDEVSDPTPVEPTDAACGQEAVLAGARRDLVAELFSRGISDPRVLDAIGSVERHRYVDESDSARAYSDRPLAIGLGQTISQPYMVALMAESAEIGEGDSVLEVGTGSGYGAAVLGCLAGEVWTIERHAKLADTARERLRRDGFDRVNVVIGDGTRGWRPAAPYDAIVVTAAPRSVPPDLLDQLADGGRLIIPVGRRRQAQTLLRVRRDGNAFTEEDLGLVRFVPLVASGRGT
jgi:protein-L-isoaspartate(D-aspartate) O-methyltransferase